MPQIPGKQLQDSAITVDKLAAGALAATATGRAKIADGFFDLPASVDAKFAAGSVNLNRLASIVLKADGTQALTADWATGGFKITGLAAPTTANDAARKTDVDTMASGLRVKDSVRLATTAALPANTAAGSGIGKTLTMTAVGVLTIDGVATVLNNRILVKNEVTALNNGFYFVSTEGTAAVAAVLRRATDFDEAAEVKAGSFCFVTEGTANGDTGWVLTTNDPITVDTTALGFTQFTGAGSFTAGAGLLQTANVVDVGAGNGISVAADSLSVNASAVASTGLAVDGTNAWQLTVLYGAVGAITTVDPGSVASAGTAATAARGDHEHPVTMAAAGDVKALAAAGALGGAARFAYADHVHARDVENQETVTSQVITNTDTALTDTLNLAPVNAASVQLFLNGVFQEQGAGKDYTISGQTITWLALTGTAVDLVVADVLTAHYISVGAAA